MKEVFARLAREDNITMKDSDVGPIRGRAQQWRVVVDAPSDCIKLAELKFSCAADSA